MISEIISGIIGAFAGGLTSYLVTKGNNLGTIEDTGLITKIQETIKNELSFSHQHKLNLMAIEREAIFDFNKSLGLLQNYMYEITFLLINQDFPNHFNFITSQLKIKYNEFEIACQHLYLFYLDDQIFLNKRKILIDKIIKYNLNISI